MIGEALSRTSIIGSVSSRCIIGDAEIGKIVIRQHETDDYDGQYIITPSSNSQILETGNKRLLENIEIKAIPYYDVTNEYGRTIYIGGDL